MLMFLEGGQGGLGLFTASSVTGVDTHRAYAVEDASVAVNLGFAVMEDGVEKPMAKAAKLVNLQMGGAPGLGAISNLQEALRLMTLSAASDGAATRMISELTPGHVDTSVSHSMFTNSVTTDFDDGEDLAVTSVPTVTSAPTISGLTSFRYGERSGRNFYMDDLALSGSITKVEILFSKFNTATDSLTWPGALPYWAYDKLRSSTNYLPDGSLIETSWAATGRTITASEWQELFRSRYFQSNRDISADETLRVTMRAYNGEAVSETIVDLIHDNNDAPQVALSGAPRVFSGRANMFIQNANLSDPDPTQLPFQARIAIQDHATLGGLLWLGSVGSNSSGIITFSSSTLAGLKTKLETVTFSTTQPVLHTQVREFTVQISDGMDWGDVQRFSVSVQPSRLYFYDVAEQVTMPFGSAFFTLDSSFSISDNLGTTNILRSVVWLTGPDGRPPTAFRLDAFRTSPGITETYDAATGRLILDGNATAGTHSNLLTSVQMMRVAAGAVPGEYRVNWMVIDSNGTPSDIVTTLVTLPAAAGATAMAMDEPTDQFEPSLASLDWL